MAGAAGHVRLVPDVRVGGVVGQLPLHVITGHRIGVDHRAVGPGHVQLVRGGRHGRHGDGGYLRRGGRVVGLHVAVRVARRAVRGVSRQATTIDRVRLNAPHRARHDIAHVVGGAVGGRVGGRDRHPVRRVERGGVVALVVLGHLGPRQHVARDAALRRFPEEPQGASIAWNRLHMEIDPSEPEHADIGRSEKIGGHRVRGLDRGDSDVVPVLAVQISDLVLQRVRHHGPAGRVTVGLSGALPLHHVGRSVRIRRPAHVDGLIVRRVVLRRDRPAMRGHRRRRLHRRPVRVAAGLGHAQVIGRGGLEVAHPVRPRRPVADHVAARRVAEGLPGTLPLHHVARHPVIGRRLPGHVKFGGVTVDGRHR